MKHLLFRRNVLHAISLACLTVEAQSTFAADEITAGRIGEFDEHGQIGVARYWLRQRIHFRNQLATEKFRQRGSLLGVGSAAPKRRDRECDVPGVEDRYRSHAGELR